MTSVKNLTQNQIKIKQNQLHSSLELFWKIQFKNWNLGKLFRQWNFGKLIFKF